MAENKEKLIEAEVKLTEAKTEHVKEKGKWDIKRYEAVGMLGIKISSAFLIVLGVLVVIYRITSVFLTR